MAKDSEVRRVAADLEAAMDGLRAAVDGLAALLQGTPGPAAVPGLEDAQ